MADFDELFEACYEELHRLAHMYLRHERPGHTLQTTDVIHDAYVRLKGGSAFECKSRAHFFAIAARAMRRVLVDYAKRADAQKRPPRGKRVSLDAALKIPFEPPSLDLLALDEALSRLEAERPQEARAFEMQYFGGMTHEEIAEVLGVASKTVQRHIALAKARLNDLM